MHPIVSNYKQLYENASSVTEKIRDGREVMSALLKVGDDQAKKDAMLQVAQIKRSVNALSTTFRQLESMVMTYKG